MIRFFITLLLLVFETTNSLAQTHEDTIARAASMNPSMGRLDTTGNDGTARYALPINLPRARGHVQPSLSLTYNSADGPSEYGYGWRLPITFIERNVNGSAYDMHGSIRANFTFVSPNERAILVSTGNRGGDIDYRPDISDRYVVFTLHLERTGPLDNTGFQSGWYATDSAGTRFFFTFGLAKDGSRCDALGSPCVRWYLDRVEDVDGNVIIYEYESMSGSPIAHLTQISYNNYDPLNRGRTGGGDHSFLHRVRLEYGSASNDSSTIVRCEIPGPLIIEANGGGIAYFRKRLCSIQVFASNTLLASYIPDYLPSTETRHYLLTSMSVGGAAGRGKMPWVQFEYEQRFDGQTPGHTPMYASFAASTDVASDNPHLGSNCPKEFIQCRSGAAWIDLDGDRRPDLVWGGGPYYKGAIYWFRNLTKPGDRNLRMADLSVLIPQSESNTSENIIFPGAISFENPTGETVVKETDHHAGTTSRIMDVNGDGRPDLVWLSIQKANPNQPNSYESYCVNVRFNSPDSPNFGGVKFKDPICMDANSIGRIYTRYPYGYVGLGLSYVWGGTLVDMVDMTGDGIVDYVIAGNNEWFVHAGYFTGNKWGFAEIPRVFKSFEQKVNEPLAIRYQDLNGTVTADLVDMNADGLPDRVVTSRKKDDEEWKSSWRVEFNNGFGFQSGAVQTFIGENKIIGPIAQGYPLDHREDKRPPFANNGLLMDFNGDGRPDYVYKQIPDDRHLRGGCPTRYTCPFIIYWNTGSTLDVDWPTYLTMPVHVSGQSYGLFPSMRIVNETDNSLGWNDQGQLIDLNSDGVLDYIYFDRPNQNWLFFPGQSARSANRPNLLKAISTAAGSRTEIMYQMGSFQNPDQVREISPIVVQTKAGGTALSDLTTKYVYKNPVYAPAWNDPLKVQSRGFEVTQVEESGLGIVSGLVTSTSWYTDYARAGLAKGTIRGTVGDIEPLESIINYPESLVQPLGGERPEAILRYKFQHLLNLANSPVISPLQTISSTLWTVMSIKELGSIHNSCKRESIDQYIDLWPAIRLRELEYSGTTSPTTQDPYLIAMVSSTYTPCAVIDTYGNALHSESDPDIYRDNDQVYTDKRFYTQGLCRNCVAEDFQKDAAWKALSHSFYKYDDETGQSPNIGVNKGHLSFVRRLTSDKDSTGEIAEKFTYTPYGAVALVTQDAPYLQTRYQYDQYQYNVVKTTVSDHSTKALVTETEYGPDGRPVVLVGPYVEGSDDKKVERSFRYDAFGRLIWSGLGKFGSNFRPLSYNQYIDDRQPMSVKNYVFSSEITLNDPPGIFQDTDKADISLTESFLDGFGRTIQVRERLGGALPANPNSHIEEVIFGYRVSYAAIFDAAGRQRILLEPFFSDQSNYQDYTSSNSDLTGKDLHAQLFQYDQYGRGTCSINKYLKVSAVDVQASDKFACISNLDDGPGHQLATKTNYESKELQGQQFLAVETIADYNNRSTNAHGSVEYYDALHNRRAIEDFYGNLVFTQVDSLQRPTKVTRYPARKRQTPVREYTKTYDWLGRMIEQTEPQVKGSYVFQYYPHGELKATILKTKKSSSGQLKVQSKVSLEYGDLGRLSKKQQMQWVEKGGTPKQIVSPPTLFRYDIPFLQGQLVEDRGRFTAGRLTWMKNGVVTIAMGYTETGLIESRSQWFESGNLENLLHSVVMDYRQDGKEIERRVHLSSYLNSRYRSLEGMRWNSTFYDSASHPISVTSRAEGLWFKESGHTIDSSIVVFRAKHTSLNSHGSYDAQGRLGMSTVDNDHVQNQQTFSPYTNRATSINIIRSANVPASPKEIYRADKITYQGGKVKSYSDGSYQYSMEYDCDGRLISYVKSGKQQRSRSRYSYFTDKSNSWPCDPRWRIQEDSLWNMEEILHEDAAGIREEVYTYGSSDGVVLVNETQGKNKLPDRRIEYSEAGSMKTADKARFQYDPEGRLIEIDEGEIKAFYSYDPLGNLCTEKLVTPSGDITKYHVGPDGTIVDTKNYRATLDFHVLLEGRRLATIRDGRALYYHRDSLGSVVETSYAGGHSGAKYKYGAYGEVEASSQVADNNASDIGYIGGRVLLNKYLLLGQRVYDSSLRRFIQPDSVDILRYTYVDGDPINKSDPTGLAATCHGSREECLPAGVKQKLMWMQEGTHITSIDLTPAPWFMIDWGATWMRVIGQYLPPSLRCHCDPNGNKYPVWERPTDKSLTKYMIASSMEPEQKTLLNKYNKYDASMDNKSLYVINDQGPKIDAITEQKWVEYQRQPDIGVIIASQQACFESTFCRANGGMYATAAYQQFLLILDSVMPFLSRTNTQNNVADINSRIRRENGYKY